MADFSEKLERLASRAHREFDGLLDYIWKTPRLIESETESELRKLESYFPLNGDPEHDACARRYRKLRWTIEGNALLRAFPAFMGASNFLCSVALFEAYALLLCAELEVATQHPVSKARGVGRSKIFSYLGQVGVGYRAMELHEQIDIAFKFRNCQVHASGLLNWSTDADELRNIVSEAKYLSVADRNRRIELGKTFDEVTILTNQVGSRLAIKNDYAWRVTAYLRDYYDGLCASATSAAASFRTSA